MTKELCFKEPKNFSHDVAALMFCWRTITASEIQRRANDPNLNTDAVLSCRDVVKQCTVDLLVNPHSSIQYWLRILKPISEDAGGDGSFVWHDDDNYFTFNGGNFYISGLTEWYRGLMDKVNTLTHKNLLFNTEIDLQKPKVIYDDISNSTPGFCFIEDIRNIRWKEKFGFHWFLDKVAFPRQDFEPLYDYGGSVTPAGNRWLSTMKDVKVAIGTLMKGVCSCSLRNSELFPLLLKESVFGRRAFYILGNEMFAVTEYDKMSYIRSNPDQLPHPLFQELSDIMFIYYLVLEPFERVLRFQKCTDLISLGQAIDVFFADHDGFFPIDTFTNFIGGETEKRFQYRLGSRSLRQVTCAITNRTVPPQVPTIGLHNFAVESAHHSKRTGDIHYARLVGIGTRHPEEVDQHVRVSTSSSTYPHISVLIDSDRFAVNE